MSSKTFWTRKYLGIYDIYELLYSTEGTFNVFSQTCSLFPGDRERKQDQRRRRVVRVKEVREIKYVERKKKPPFVWHTHIHRQNGS